MIACDNAQLLDQIAWDLVYGEADRSLRRSLVNGFFNGDPPYSKEDAAKNQIRVNVNKLTAPRLAHDARSQYYNGLMTQERYFTATADISGGKWGPRHKLTTNCGTVTREINRILKDSIEYYESQNADIAQVVLHGITPGVWEAEDKLIPRPIGVEDVLIPARTLLGFSNLPFFYLRRSFTAMELEEVTRDDKRDPGWNGPFVERCLQWLDEEISRSQMTNNIWPPDFKYEQWEELKKEGGGSIYGSDQVPTLDAFDIYVYQEASGKEPAGWVRRIILDSWSNAGFNPGTGETEKPTRRGSRKPKDTDTDLSNPGKNDFLYTSGRRTVGASWQNIVKFQFADLSAVAPKRYHSVRSLGWLTYAQCHLESRLYCKTMEAGFEALMQLFQVDSMDDVQKALKMELSNFAVIDKTLTPVKASDRFQPNANLIELCIGMNGQLIDRNASSWTAQPQQQKKERETNFQRMADLQAMNALVSAGIAQFYAYKRFEYIEMLRRAMKRNSNDPLVRRFRENCLRMDVPEKLISCPEAWDVQCEKMMGGGNQTLELMIAKELLELMPALEPESKRIVLRKAIQAISKDPALGVELVPESPVKVTSATHDAELAASALLQGIPVEPLTGVNLMEYTEQMIKILALRVKAGMKTGMVDAKELKGMQAIAQNIAQHIKIIAQDKNEKDRVKKYGDILGKLVNLIKAFGQRLKAAMQKQAQGNGNGGDPKDAAKVKAMLMGAAVKGKIAEGKAQQAMRHKEAKFRQDLKLDALQKGADISAQDLETAANIQRNSLFDEPEDEQETTE